MNRTTVTTSVATAALVGVAALGVAAPALAGAGVFRTAGAVTPMAPVVPATAEARVQTVAVPGGGAKVLLTVSGLAANESYGAHLHVETCEAPVSPRAGSHYQRVIDPMLASRPRGAASTDPVYANAQNEVWLDLTTDATGEGHAKATKTWQFDPARPPGSVIIHADHTSTGGLGQPPAGSAGARLACLTLQY